MTYDFQDPNHTQQIDVFAADNECVIIVECKSAETRRDSNFKTLYEQIHKLHKTVLKWRMAEDKGWKVASKTTKKK